MLLDIATCKNGDVDLSMTVNHLLELKRWVLSWGADVKVVEPDYFDNDIETTLRRAVEGYQESNVWDCGILSKNENIEGTLFY